MVPSRWQATLPEVATIPALMVPLFISNRALVGRCDTVGSGVPLALPCLPHLDTIVVNELEAAALTEREPPASNVGDEIDWGALEVIAQEVVRRGIRRLAVVHFPAGCVAADRDGRTWRHGSVRMPPVPPSSH